MEPLQLLNLPFFVGRRFAFAFAFALITFFYFDFSELPINSLEVFIEKMVIIIIKTTDFD